MQVGLSLLFLNRFSALKAIGAAGLVYTLASGVTVCFQFDFATEKILREALSALPLLFLFALNMTDAWAESHSSVIRSGLGGWRFSHREVPQYPSLSEPDLLRSMSPGRVWFSS